MIASLVLCGALLSTAWWSMSEGRHWRALIALIFAVYFAIAAYGASI